MLFGSSGIRRRYDGDLVTLAMQVGKAVASDAKTVITGRDTRTTGEVIAAAFMAGAASEGARVINGGIVPTPTIAYNARNADNACMVTASHNPEPYNGLKLFNPDGSSFTRNHQEKIEKEIQEIAAKPGRDWKRQGTIEISHIIKEHESAISSRVRIKDGLRMVIDCGNGAGSVITPTLLREMGVITNALNADTSGVFSRQSEPLPENMSYIPSIIKKTGSSGAVVHDGDADRMMAYDNNGNFIPGDVLLILFAKYLDAKRVVTTYDASMAIDEVAEVRRTPVGDAYVSEQLVRWGDFGGEPSGAWIFPVISYCPDGPYAAALFCEMAGEWNIAGEIAEIPQYPILRTSIEIPSAYDLLYGLGATNPTDGIRIEDDDGWCLIRASGTEPKVRLTAEGRTPDIAKRLLDKGQEMVHIMNKEVTR